MPERLTGRILFAVDVLVTDPISGKRRGLAGTIRRTLRALGAADFPFCVIGATALAVRGLPRMTRDPEATAIDQAEEVEVFGVRAPVATLEHLLLMYLYSNQPKHLGDFASIVQSQHLDLTRVERLLAIMHPEMLDDYRQRIELVRSPPPPPARPPARRR